MKYWNTIYVSNQISHGIIIALPAYFSGWTWQFWQFDVLEVTPRSQSLSLRQTRNFTRVNVGLILLNCFRDERVSIRVPFKANCEVEHSGRWGLDNSWITTLQVSTDWQNVGKSRFKTCQIVKSWVQAWNGRPFSGYLANQIRNAFSHPANYHGARS